MSHDHFHNSPQLHCDNNIATCKFFFSVSDYICTLLLQTTVDKCDYVAIWYNKWNTLIAAVIFTTALSPTIWAF